MCEYPAMQYSTPHKHLVKGFLENGTKPILVPSEPVTCEEGP